MLWQEQPSLGLIGGGRCGRKWAGVSLSVFTLSHLKMKPRQQSDLPINSVSQPQPRPPGGASGWGGQLSTGQEDLYVNRTIPNGQGGSTLTANLDGLGPASKTLYSVYASLKRICTTIIWVLDTG